MAGDNDEVERPLLASKGETRQASSPQSSSLWSIRLVSYSSLVMLVVATVYFQWKVHQLGVHMANDDSQIHSLQNVIEKQAIVIERFNNSVTNSDVLSRLDTLEHTLENTKKALKHDLETTQLEIKDELTSTLNLLNQTVKRAEEEIEVEVDLVKADVEKYVRTTQDQFSMENSFMVYQLAGTFTLLSCLISMWHMTAHLRKFNQPVVQRKILAILWMSPIYAITSWFSLVFHASGGYLAIIKDFYEAYVIYQFLSFCIAVLGRGNREAVVDLLARHASHLTPPFRLCGCFCPDPYETDRQLAYAVLMQCQRFAMQFVFLRPLTSIALVVLDKMDIHGQDYRSPQFYIIMIQNLSVFIAFTGLLKFYHAVDQDLAWCRPFAKFLCIKGVVFMTFWQGLAIAILAGTTDAGGDDSQEWAKSAQNFLICLEMLLFSIAHFYCFPTEEWEEDYQARHSETQFGDTVALGDFVHDLKLVLRSQSRKRRMSDAKVTIIDEKKTEIEIREDEGEQDGAVEESAVSTPKARGAKQAAKSPDQEEEDAIQDIIDRGSDVGDDEIEEATKRLLAYTLLQDEIDDIWNDDDDVKVSTAPDDDQHQAASSHENAEVAVETDESEELTARIGYGSDDFNATRNVAASSDEPPNERTSLLGFSSTDSLRSQNEELLRPSIFTTVTAIARKAEDRPADAEADGAPR